MGTESRKKGWAFQKGSPGSKPLSCHCWEGWLDNNGDIMRAEKPLPQGPPGGVIGILGGVVAIGLIAGVAVTVIMVHRRQQKTRTETDNDL
ncbi:unnamed protein product [Tetraodon nigroviridis]|uniref:Chromosome 16 SCAF15002, whole genome shotgun sequence n=1 Tax=Tetraodon nigroviridis TaxID=99883 RepID=Q4RRC3_TETNG|nr:unnamed protein product [Tetraodon nigroviridis]